MYIKQKEFKRSIITHTLLRCASSNFFSASVFSNAVIRCFCLISLSLPGLPSRIARSSFSFSDFDFFFFFFLKKNDVSERLK